MDYLTGTVYLNRLYSLVLDAIKDVQYIEYHSHLMNHLADLLVNFDNLLPVIELLKIRPTSYPYLTQQQVASIVCSVLNAKGQPACDIILQRHKGLYPKRGIKRPFCAEGELPLYSPKCTSYQNQLFNQPTDGTNPKFTVYDANIDWMKVEPGKRFIVYIPERLRNTLFMIENNIPYPTHTHPPVYKIGEDPNAVDQLHHYNLAPYSNGGFGSMTPMNIYEWRTIHELMGVPMKGYDFGSQMVNKVVTSMLQPIRSTSIPKPKPLNDKPETPIQVMSTSEPIPHESTTEAQDASTTEVGDFPAVEENQ